MTILECCKTIPGAWFEIYFYYIDDAGCLRPDDDYSFTGTLEDLEEYNFDNWAKFDHNSPYECSTDVKPDDFNIKGEGADMVCNIHVLMDDVSWEIIRLPSNSVYR